MASVDGIPVVAVHGEADLSNKDDLEATLDEALSASGLVLVDLCDCSFLDSSALAVIVRAWQRAAGAGGRCAVSCREGNAPARLFAMAIPDTIELHPDRAAGLAALRREEQ